MSCDNMICKTSSCWEYVVNV